MSEINKTSPREAFFQFWIYILSSQYYKQKPNSPSSSAYPAFMARVHAVRFVAEQKKKTKRLLFLMSRQIHWKKVQSARKKNAKNKNVGVKFLAKRPNCCLLRRIVKINSPTDRKSESICDSMPHRLSKPVLVCVCVFLQPTRKVEWFSMLLFWHHTHIRINIYTYSHAEEILREWHSVSSASYVCSLFFGSIVACVVVQCLMTS